MDFNKMNVYKMLESDNMDVYTTNDPNVIMVGGKNETMNGSRILIVRDGNNFKIYANEKLFSVSAQKETLNDMKFNVANINFEPIEANVLPLLNLDEIKNIRNGEYSTARDSYMKRTGLLTSHWLIVHDNFRNNIEPKTNLTTKPVNPKDLDVGDIITIKKGVYEDYRLTVIEKGIYGVDCDISYIPPEAEDVGHTVGGRWWVSNNSNDIYYLIKKAFKNLKIENKAEQPKSEPVALIKSANPEFKSGDTFRHNGTGCVPRWKGQELKLNKKANPSIWDAEVIKADAGNDYPVGTKEFKVSEKELKDYYTQFTLPALKLKVGDKFSWKGAHSTPLEAIVESIDNDKGSRTYHSKVTKGNCCYNVGENVTNFSHEKSEMTPVVISEEKKEKKDFTPINFDKINVGDILMFHSFGSDLDGMKVKITDRKKNSEIDSVVIWAPNDCWKKIGDHWPVLNPAMYSLIESVKKELTSFDDVNIGDLLIRNQDFSVAELLLVVKNKDNNWCNGQVINIGSANSSLLKLDDPWCIEVPRIYRKSIFTPVTKKEDLKSGDLIFVDSNESPAKGSVLRVVGENEHGHVKCEFVYSNQSTHKRGDIYTINQWNWYQKIS